MPGSLVLWILLRKRIFVLSYCHVTTMKLSSAEAQVAVLKGNALLRRVGLPTLLLQHSLSFRAAEPLLTRFVSLLASIIVLSRDAFATNIFLLTWRNDLLYETFFVIYSLKNLFIYCSYRWLSQENRRCS